MLKIAALFLIILAGCTPAPQTNPEAQTQDTLELASNQETEMNNQAPEIAQEKVLVELTTSKGVIKMELNPGIAPNTVANFVDKANSGHYEGLTFHRVEDWVVQGGDPDGDGTGGGNMPTELSSEPFVLGSVGVARGMVKEISNDSQFFICTQDCSWLTGDYTNFGIVVEGMSIVNAIEIGDKIESIAILED